MIRHVRTACAASLAAFALVAAAGCGRGSGPSSLQESNAAVEQHIQQAQSNPQLTPEQKQGKAFRWRGLQRQAEMMQRTQAANPSNR